MKALQVVSVDGRRPEEAVLLGVRGRQGMERWEDPELQVEASTAQREAEGLQPEPGPEVLAHALAVADSVVSGAGVLKIGIWVDSLLRSSVEGAPGNRASHHMPCHTEA